MQRWLQSRSGLATFYLDVMRNAASELAEMIDPPPYSYVTFGMAVGDPEPDRMSDVRPRMPQPVVLHPNQYKRERYCEFLDGYENTYRQYREARNIKPKTWQNSVYEATTSMEYMSGRVHLRDMFIERGFGLR